MFDRLIDLVVQFIELFRFFTVMNCFEEGVVLRFGRYKRNITSENGVFGTGLHLIYPFNIEKIMFDNIVPATAEMSPQSLTTKCGVQITVAVSITWSINDIKKFLLEFEDLNSLMKNSVVGIISNFVQDHTWDELIKLDLPKTFQTEVRRRAHRWGVNVVELQVQDFSKARTYRFFVSQDNMYRESKL